ncbi:MAG: UTP--glucose-1-phosphate uridylyltransferase GalU [Dehalococcoidia bacterium]|nr:UTP--glucose-1-phosphate uridylyltransferase GalU [Dehalococcoidia bacterium]
MLKCACHGLANLLLVTWYLLLHATRCVLTQVRKAVILAAGYGTRLLPATKSQPKEMLPLVDRPIIHYSVEEAVNSGITQVIMVTAFHKRAVEDYFDRSRDIEDMLEEKGDFERLEEMRRISKMADFAYVRQGEPRGLGDAVLTARHLVGDEPFALILPDDVIVGAKPTTRQLIDCYEQHHVSVVAVQEVPEADTPSYGIVAGDPDPSDDRVTRLRLLVEKPALGTAPSRLAIVGRYLLTPAIFEAIERTNPGYGGEIQITDAMQMLAGEEGMYAYRFEGERFDTGRPLGLLVASITMGLARPDVGPELRRFLRGIDLSEA